MSAHSAERRLVKSSPELWAGVSDQESLGRHLHAFGEISITGTDPETTVAWEGDEVSGTVVIASAGWGTKVTLTVEVVDSAAATPVPPAPAPEVIAAPEPDTPVARVPEPEPETPVARVPEREPEPTRKPEPAAAPEPDPAEAAPAKRAKQGFFARLFDFGPAVPDPQRQVEASEEPTPDPEPQPTPEPEPTAQPPAEPEPIPDPIVVPEVEPEISTEAPEPAPLSAEAIDEILSAVLDDLGAAHHRPYSRS
jgi:hypothetical protein